LFLAVLALSLSVNGSQLLPNTTCIAAKPCTCFFRMGYNVYCEYLNLTEVPEFYTAYVNYTDVSISLKANLLTTVHNGTFIGLSFADDVEISMDLSYNNIETLETEAFAGIAKYVFPTALSGMVNLQQLYFNFNPLKTLDPLAFHAFGQSLTYLTFDMGHFQSWPNELSYLNVLRTFDLFNLPFADIPLRSLQSLKDTLFGFIIVGKNLTTFPKEVCSLHSLGSLTIFDNPNLAFGTDLPLCLNIMRNLKFLDFENNILDNIPDILETFPAVVELGLLNKSIRDFGDTAFAGATKLDSLNLNSNILHGLPAAVSQIPSLKQLFLTNNSISDIDKDVMHNLTKVQNLFLYVNTISQIADDTFALTTQLQWLDLRYNNLTSLPLSIMNLKNLTKLCLDENPIECSCSAMKKLKSWDTSNMILDGICSDGKMLIQDYIQKVLPKC